MAQTEVNSPIEIYGNWLNGTGHCKQCNRRDESLIADPYFGFGDFPADIVFIGEAPGGTATGRNNSLDTDRRVWKNYSEVEEEGGSMSSKTIDDFSLEFGKMGTDHRSQLDPFFCSVERELGEETRIYYTNVAKCNDIWDKEEDIRRSDLNEKDSCRSYLLPELKAADPKGIVIFSKGVEHIEGTLSTLGVETPSHWSSVTDYVFNPEYQRGTSPFRVHYTDKIKDEREIPVIVSYHYKQGYTWTTRKINDGMIKQSDIGQPNRNYDSSATTPRAKYADGIAETFKETLH